MNFNPSSNQRHGICISEKQLQLSNILRLLWEQHVYWTRFAISGIVFNTPDADQSSQRLLQNPEDFAAVLAPLYGEDTAARFAKLFTSHLTIAAQLITELKNGDRIKAAQTERSWYQNADQIAAFLAQINPYWSMREWQDMLYNHLRMTKNEAVALISEDYAASVALFDRIEHQALMMADAMTTGIMRQFFNNDLRLQ